MKRTAIILKTILALILSLILGIVGVTLILVFVAPLLVCRCIVKNLAKVLKREDFRTIIAPISALTGAEDLYSHRALTSVGILQLSDPEPDLNSIREVIERGIYATDPTTGALLYPELRECPKQWMGYFFWAPVKNFDIKEHVYIYNDNEKLDSPEAMQNCCTKLIRKKWKKDGPLWEFILIPNVPSELFHTHGASTDAQENAKGSLVLFRIHHILGDGISCFKFLNKVFGFADGLERTLTAKEKDTALRENIWLRIYKGVKTVLNMVYDASWHLMELLKSGRIPILGDAKGDDLISSISNDIPLSKLKAIKTQHGVTLSAVVAAIFAGGCRRQLLRYRNDEVATLPKYLSVASPLPMPNHPDDKLTNYFAAGAFNIPIREPDGAKRLAKIDKTLSELKSSTLPTVGYLCLILIGSLPLPIAKLIRLNKVRIRNLPPLLLTSVKGPEEALTFRSSRVLGLLIGANYPADGPLGYGMMVSSYNGNVRFSLGALSSYLPTPKHAEELLDGCLQEINELSLIV